MTVINLADRLINGNATQETGKESSVLVQRLEIETKIELTSSNKCESNNNLANHLPPPSIF